MTEETTVKVPKDRIRLDVLAKRARERRAKKNMLDAANASLNTKRAIQEQTWKRNIAALSPKQRDELNARIGIYNYICWDVCYDGARRMSSGEPYGSNDGGIDLRPEQWLAEVEAFVVEHPLQETDLELWKFYDYERAPTDQMGEHFKQFGPDFAIDFIDTVAYTSFLAAFRGWYRANRLKLTLVQDLAYPFSRTWEQVDGLMAKNPRLAGIKPIPVAPPREPAAPVAPPPLTESQRINLTLRDLHRAGGMSAEEI